MVRVSNTVKRLYDKVGLRPEERKAPEVVVAAVGPATPVAACAEPLLSPVLLPPEAAYERRRRTLSFWRSAMGAPVTLRMRENTVCDGELLAVDAAQALMHVAGLATPMGRYPYATVRTSDVLCVEPNELWRVSPGLPADPQAPASAPQQTGAAGGSSGKPAAQTLEEAKRALAADFERLLELPSGGEPDEAEAEAEAEGEAQAEAAATRSLAVGGWDPRHAETQKYYVQRYMLFSKYDDGVILDREGWFSVTPEVLAAHLAERCCCDLIVDAFAGVGGNAIQFAFTCERVIAIDIDAERLRIAKHNAAVYGVADRITFVHADFLALAPRLRADVVFLSPPWGGPEYAGAERFDVVTMMGGLDGAQVLRAALGVAPNVAYFLPRNVDRRQARALAEEAGVPLELERNFLNKHEKALTAYYGFEEEEQEQEQEQGREEEEAQTQHEGSDPLFD